MTFLISQIAIFLALAMLAGGAAGWLLSQSSQRQKLEESQTRVDEARQKRRRSESRRHELEEKLREQQEELSLALASASELREAFDQQAERVSSLEKLRQELKSALKGAEIKLEEERRGRVMDRQALELSRVERRDGSPQTSTYPLERDAEIQHLKAAVIEGKNRLEEAATEIDALKRALTQAHRAHRGTEALEATISDLKKGLARREQMLRAKEADHLELQARLLNEQEAAARERDSAESAARELRLSLSRQIAALDAFQGSI